MKSHLTCTAHVWWSWAHACKKYCDLKIAGKGNNWLDFPTCRKRSRLHLSSLENIEAWPKRYQKHWEDEQVGNKYYKRIVWWLYQYATQGAALDTVSWRASVLRLPVLRMFVEFISCVCEHKFRNRKSQISHTHQVNTVPSCWDGILCYIQP